MPDECDSAAWFTNLTGERFVRLVRNLDVLERVYTMETQIMQIKDAIGIQNNRVVVVNVVWQCLETYNARNNFFSHNSKRFDKEFWLILNSSIDSATVIRPQSLRLVPAKKLMEILHENLLTMSLIALDFSYLPDVKVPGKRAPLFSTKEVALKDEITD
ncbi:hypothetical protein YC2023_023929 [Brassica napus]